MPAAWLTHLKSGLARKASGDRIEGLTCSRPLKRAIARVLPYLQGHARTACWGGVFIGASILVGFAPPLVTRFLVDHVILGGRKDLLAASIFILVACLIVEKLLRLGEEFCFARFEQQVLLGIHNDLLERTLKLPKAFFDEQQTGYLTRRLTEDVEGLRFIFSGTMAHAAGHLLRLAGGVGLLLYLEWRLALAVVAVLPALGWALNFFSDRIHLLGRARLEYQAEAAGRVQESLGEVAAIKAFAAEERTRDRIMLSFRRFLQVAFEQAMVSSLCGLLIQSIPGVGRVVALAAGAVLLLRGEWTLGSLLAFQAYLAYVFGPAQFLSSVNLQLQRARAALERVSALFDVVPEEMREDGLRVQSLRGDIEFRNVSFAYGNPVPVLDDVSFRVHAGETVAVMGASGVGKTTLISLLLGFYLPTAGRVLFDGKPVEAYALKSLRRRLGYVPQNPRLVTGNILENLRLGAPEASMGEILKATRAAAVHETVLSLAAGYHTRVGEGGASLSEGQRQRLALARALVTDPDILILDEPTSALDTKTEQTLLGALSSWRRGKTLVVVTHRQSTADLCDRVLRLDEHGRLDETVPMGPIGFTQDFRPEPQIDRAIASV